MLSSVLDHPTAFPELSLGVSDGNFVTARELNHALAVLYSGGLLSPALTDYLLGALQQHGIEQVKTPLVTVSVRINPWSVEVTDVKALPPEYQTVKIEPNKKALLAARESVQFDGVTYQKSISLRIS